MRSFYSVELYALRLPAALAAAGGRRVPPW
jgi:hypothetical protein